MRPLGRFKVSCMLQVTPACSNLLMRLLDPDPDLRISLDEALQHPWIAAHPAAAHPQARHVTAAGRLSVTIFIRAVAECLRLLPYCAT
jgi:hypothetical protein